jgi:L-histidine N-alpha-methyltransferase
VRSLFDSNKHGGEDYLLLGIDLVGEENRRTEKRTITVSDNSLSAAIRRNHFLVLNRELLTNFSEDAYKVAVEWVRDENESRVEVYNVTTTQQHIVIPPLPTPDGTGQPVEVTIEEGEPLLRVISVKFTREGLEVELREAGMQLVEWYTDDQGRAALALAKKCF